MTASDLMQRIEEELRWLKAHLDALHALNDNLQRVSGRHLHQALSEAYWQIVEDRDRLAALRDQAVAGRAGAIDAFLSSMEAQGWQITERWRSDVTCPICHEDGMRCYLESDGWRVSLFLCQRCDLALQEADKERIRS